MHKILRYGLVCLCFMAIPPIAQASLLGVAADYNLFMVGAGDINRPSIELVGTDVQGRVAARGDLKSSFFSIGSAVPPSDQRPVLVVGGDLQLYSGSLGANPDQLGTAVAGGNVTLERLGNGDSSVGHGGITGSSALPIDFAKEQSYLTGMSDYWGRLTPNGSILTRPDQLMLTADDASLNIFSIRASDILPKQDFRIYAPLSSTVLVNITGEEVNLIDFGFFFNDAPGDIGDGQYAYNPNYPYSSILFNFLDAREILIDLVEINGSLLAPFAHIDFMKDSHIDGNLIAYSLSGEGEGHNVIFNGKLPAQPVPEPATLILLGGGLFGIAACRRKVS